MNTNLITVTAQIGKCIYHIEMEDMVRFIADTQASGLLVGLAYDIDTPLDGLENFINDLDGVLLMSVKAGTQGEKKLTEKPQI